MKISIIGVGYVGLVTGVCLAEIGHKVICLDIDPLKVEMLKTGKSPIYEPGLEEMMKDNMKRGRLFFTSDPAEALHRSSVTYIAVGTPERHDGSADLTYVDSAAFEIAKNVDCDTVVVMKSTVPVGTNERVEKIIRENTAGQFTVDVVSNPEFLKEGDAIKDSFNGDRIIIGAENERAARIVERINQPFGLPVYKTDRKSAEMIKYASNAFLATKISFINEISNICELLGADVENVAVGMGMDKRIGADFLKAGIGYGGSCFPKDTKALIQIAGNVAYDFRLLKGVISVNQQQQGILLKKLNACFPSLAHKRIAVLGLAFKPGTDDMREAASILVTNELVSRGARVVAYDPIAMGNARILLDSSITYARNAEEAIVASDAVLILTEWPEIRQLKPDVFLSMKRPLVIDGRNCYEPAVMQGHGITYHSIGRTALVAAETIPL
ncbi:UDP-glucose/GDP-mannose dehydrogenase family protein [Planomicrobium sp. YIM 101495]|uniref:UDP-glucose dehydrogenase family protein n=1 Tax=Planomicrobium sp. YIM 101495 TaxID=2665160 RepID=UPI0012B94583|nr:UDP-glucose/GDP-mannose dehydrogenase family protein [Planomicrobium sp. YIM 101495]MTD30553.1 nucleotide sugar dehydrogenase [Planomicrobium sp. YIM 101495]